MTKVTMPDPVAWLHEEGDHIITAAEKRAANATFTRYGQGLITTTQAEAYADARVRVALEDLIDTLETRQFGGQDQIIRAARALIPPTKNEAEE